MKRQVTFATMLVLTFLSTTFAISATLTVPSQYPSLGEALDAALSGDVISIEPGIYFESGLNLPEGISIVGTSSTANEVVLDGQHLGRIMLAEGLESETAIENITFRNGKAFGASSYAQSGGAIFCSNSVIRLTNCYFQNNEADSHGGAVRCTNSSPVISQCVFTDNSAFGGGGAIDCSYNSSPSIDDCKFYNNVSDWGGALSCRVESSPQISDTTFDGNSTEGSRGYGGAVFADHQSQPVFNKSVFSDNTATYGGAAACFAGAAANIESCTLSGNEAEQEGGGLFIFEASQNISGSIIAFNNGMGISILGESSIEIGCSNIYGNTQGNWDGAINDQFKNNGNTSVNPLFCSVTPGDNSRFYLEENSPMIKPGGICSTMGALPVGCAEPSGFDISSGFSGVSSVNAYPNPFNPTTVINFEIGNGQHVRVTVFNLQGALVRTLIDEELASGQQVVQWNGKDNAGRSIGSGTYIVVVEGAKERHTQKLTMLK